MRMELSEAGSILFELVGKIIFGGEDQIIFTMRGTPVAKLVDYHAEPYKTRLGIAKGVFTVPDDFDSDDAEIAKMFGA